MPSTARANLAALLALPAMDAPGAAKLLDRHAMSQQIAVALASKAVEICASKSFDVGAAVADAHGDVRVMISGDSVSALSIETARRKARSAALVGFPTAKLADAVREAPGYVDMLRQLHPDMIFIGGGVPVRYHGELIGAIGVGGASDGSADEACATAAIAALSSQLN